MLALKYRDHALTGDYIGYRECHIQPFSDSKAH